MDVELLFFDVVGVMMKWISMNNRNTNRHIGLFFCNVFFVVSCTYIDVVQIDPNGSRDPKL